MSEEEYGSEHIDFEVEDQKDMEVGKPCTLFPGNYMIVVPNGQKATIIYDYICKEDNYEEDTSDYGDDTI